jgi:hypothetical protein
MKNIMFHTSNQNSTGNNSQKSSSVLAGNNGSGYNELSNSIYTYAQNQFNSGNNTNIHQYVQNGNPNDYFYYNGVNGLSYNPDGNNSSANSSNFQYKTFNVSNNQNNQGFYNNNKN